MAILVGRIGVAVPAEVLGHADGGLEAGGLAGTAYGLTWAAVAAASLIAFTAYMMYYRMDDDTAYITGAVPLLVDGAVTLMIALLGW